MAPGFSAVTNADGKAMIPTIGKASHPPVMNVNTPDYGVVQVRVHGTPEAGVQITLRPSAHVIGTVTCEGPRQIAHRRFTLVSTPIGNLTPYPDYSAKTPTVWQVGIATVETDERGRFEVARIAEGALNIVPQEPADAAYLARPPEHVLVNAGQTNAIQIPLQKAVRVIVTFRDRDSRQPIFRVNLIYDNQHGGRHVVTSDEAGRCVLPRLPGNYTVVVEPPSPYIPPANGFSGMQISVPSDKAEYEPPLVELVRGVKLTGRVLMPSDKPAAKAKIAASMDSATRTYGSAIHRHFPRRRPFRNGQGRIWRLSDNQDELRRSADEQRASRTSGQQQTDHHSFATHRIGRAQRPNCGWSRQAGASRAVSDYHHA